MFGVALTAASCLRAGTDVHLVWLVAADGLGDCDATEAVALTPGGGRMGALAQGRLDGHLGGLPRGGVPVMVKVTLSETDALIHAVQPGSSATLAIVPGRSLPEAVWPLLFERAAFALSAPLDEHRLGDFTLHVAGDSDEVVAPLLAAGRSTSVVTSNRLISVFHPVPHLAVFGGGPNGQALEAAARLLGWNVSRTTDTEQAVGLMTGLGPLDSAVVMGHDVESSSRVLGAALEGRARYIGSLGSLRMQEQRAAWLAYRGIDDLTRVHGPAGLNIGASTPAEIALSVLAEAVAVHREAPAARTTKQHE